MAKKKKQTDLGLKGPGVEKQSIPELDDASEEYVAARDRRMALSKTEK